MLLVSFYQARILKDAQWKFEETQYLPYIPETMYFIENVTLDKLLIYFARRTSLLRIQQ
jgi:hypothetical protein